MTGAVLWRAVAGGIRAVARMSLRQPRQHGGNAVLAHVHRPSTRQAASQPRGARVGGVGGVGAAGPATRAAAAVGAIARRNAGASTGRIDRTLAVGIAPSGSPRAMRSAAVILNASNDDDDENDASERVNLDLDDDPFEHVALPPIDDAAFDAMLDDIIEDDDEAEGEDASSAPAGSYSMPGDELPWDASGAWPEFDALLGKLMAKGYKIEVDPVADGGPGEGAVDTSVSTPEWARAVAESYEDEDETDDLADPFATVAKQKGEWDTDDDDDSLVELSYANKKRLLLEFSRDREDLLRKLLSAKELYILADHALPKDQGNAGGRKQVNAMKRLRARLGVDASDLAHTCAAVGGGDTMGACTFSDVTRLIHVFADDVSPQFRPERSSMQSLLRRITALADTDKPADYVPEPAPEKLSAQPKWVDRRERRPPRREYEEDRYVRPGSSAGRGRGGGRGGRGYDSPRGRGRNDSSFNRPTRGGRNERYYDDDDGYRPSPRGRAMERGTDDGFGGYGGGGQRGRDRGFDDRNERGFDRFERGRSSRDGFYDRGDDGWDTRLSRGGRGGRGFDSQRGRGRGRGDRPGMGDRNADFGRRARTKGGFGSDLDGLDRGEDDGGGGDRGGDRDRAYGARGDSFRGGERGRAYERFGPREQERRGRAAMGGRGGRGRGGGMGGRGDRGGGRGWSRGRDDRDGGDRGRFDDRNERGFDSREDRGGFRRESREDRGERGGGDRNRVRMWKPKNQFGEEEGGWNRD